MDPKKWRESQGLSQTKVAELIELGSPSSVSALERGIAACSPRTAALFEIISEGAVTPNDLLACWKHANRKEFEHLKAVGRSALQAHRKAVETTARDNPKQSKPKEREIGRKRRSA